MSRQCFQESDNCGESRGMSSLTRLVDCEDDINVHLATYHLSREKLLEYQLILARTGLFDSKYEDVSNFWVCPRHRHTLGKYWLPSKRGCNCPIHTGPMKTLAGQDVVSYDMAKWMQKLYSCNVQIGTGKRNSQDRGRGEIEK